MGEVDPVDVELAIQRIGPRLGQFTLPVRLAARRLLRLAGESSPASRPVSPGSPARC